MARFADPFDPLQSLQQALEAFRSSNWLSPGPSGLSGYPLMNMFRKDDDFIIVAEVPGVKKSDLNIEVKGNTIRLAGTKSVTYPENASLHRRERPQGRFDRAVTLPFAVSADGVKAEYRDGILALYLPRAEHDKPRSIQIT
jgi:HSP20 family protein